MCQWNWLLNFKKNRLSMCSPSRQTRTVFVILVHTIGAKFDDVTSIMNQNKVHLSVSKVCQMLFWWTKNSLHSINIWGIVTKVLPLCSVYQAPCQSWLIWACYSFWSRQCRPAPEWITCSNKLPLLILVLETWILAHMMALNMRNKMVPHLWQYLRYWWNERNFSSIMTTFDRLY